LGQSGYGVEQLTRREEEIPVLLAKGVFYKEIAEGLSISMSTMRTHIQPICEKLHGQSYMEAARKYFGGNY
jgi:DNA-binding NarL/FixJ family response regulator